VTMVVGAQMVARPTLFSPAPGGYTAKIPLSGGIA
jgi:hypothetical protein